jgi:hypothetical protein
MKVAAPMLVHEVIGLAIPGKVDIVAPLLHKVAKVNASGGMPQPLAADNKEDLHAFVTRIS